MSESNIKVSVITPIYNSSRYLRKCIDSFFEQSLSPIEMIVVDDKSPDNSVQIANEYKSTAEKKIIVISHKVNKRAGGARNTGLLAAHGEYVLFLDADDWMEKDMLNTMYSAAINNACDLVSCNYFEASDENKSFKTVTSVPFELNGELTIEKKKQYLIKGSAGFTKLVKRSLILKYKLFYPEKVMFEDNGIVPLFGLCASKISVITDPLYFYRIDNQTSQTKAKKTDQIISDRMQSALYFVNKSKELDLFDIYYKEIECYFVNIFYSSILKYYISGDYSFDKTFLKNMQKQVMDIFPRYKRNNLLKINKRNHFCQVIGDHSYLMLKFMRLIWRIFHGK